VALAAGRNDPSVVYVLAEDGILYRLVDAVFRPVDNVPAALFSSLASGPGSSSQGGYDIVLAVDPDNANTVYLGGDSTWDGDRFAAALFKGTITARSGTYVFPFLTENDVSSNLNPTTLRVPRDPTWIGRRIHADLHALAFSPLADGTGESGEDVWAGCDGGVFRSRQRGALGSFVDRNNGLAITQLTYLAQHPETDAVVLCGSQDNGTVLFRGDAAWSLMASGDGGGVAIDPTAPHRLIRQYAATTLDYSTDAGRSWWPVPFPPVTDFGDTAQTDAAATEHDIASFYGPIAVSARSSGEGSRLALGTNRVWLSEDWGNSWVTLPAKINPYSVKKGNEILGTDVIPSVSPKEGNQIVALVFAAESRLFVATASSVWQYDELPGQDGAKRWERKSLPLDGLPEGRLIHSVVVEDAAIRTLYVALNWSSDSHIYYFDGKGRWVPAGIAVSEETGPARPVNAAASAVVVDRSDGNRIYAGTDVGCWRGTKSLASDGKPGWTWELFSKGLPEAAVLDLAIFDPGKPDRPRLLRAATYGRGLWEIPLRTASGVLPRPPDPDIYLRVNSADSGRMGPDGNRYPWIEAAIDPTAAVQNPHLDSVRRVYHWMSPDIKIRRAALGGLPSLPDHIDFLDFAASVGDFAYDEPRIAPRRDDQIAGLDRVFVQVHNRGTTAVPGEAIRLILLETDSAVGLPRLPDGLADLVASGRDDESVKNTAWRFSDLATAYRLLPGLLDARRPRVAEYAREVAPLSPAGGLEHVTYLAIAVMDPEYVKSQALLRPTFGARERLLPGIDQASALVLHDKHVACRNVHLLTSPAHQVQKDVWEHAPQSFLALLYNSGTKATRIDLAFHRQDFKGRLWLSLPKLAVPLGMQGFRSGPLEAQIPAMRDRRADWFARALKDPLALGAVDSGATQKRLRLIDPQTVFEAEDGPISTLLGIPADAQGCIPAVITVQGAQKSKPEDQFVFHLIQKQGNRIVGGSTYIFAVIFD
jgi:hypothetical protein